jgi:16S rRNA (guanine966-N2)-methyltransferase
MRITAGINKGKKLSSFRSHDIRPTIARVRKSFFDVLGESIIGSMVLDLFAGTGALGIEALARGSRYVLFVDFSNEALRLIRKNLEKCGFSNAAGVQSEKLPQGIHDIKGIFNLIFLDPPYEKGLAEKCLIIIGDSGLLQAGGRVVAQVGRKEELLDRYGQIVLISMKKYGDTKLYFYERR